MFVQDGEDMSPEEESGDDELDSAEEEARQEVVNTKIATLSLNSLAGFHSPKTIKVCERIQGRDVVVLIDGGTTHNFVSEKVVNQLQLPIRPTEGYGVVLGTRDLFGPRAYVKLCCSLYLI